MNKRDTLLDVIHSHTPPTYLPAAFFMHFDHSYHEGQAAIDKHLEFFRATGMDFVKIQYEQGAGRRAKALGYSLRSPAPRGYPAGWNTGSKT
jgi:uroporphyrinogen decarboxylase